MAEQQIVTVLNDPKGLVIAKKIDSTGMINGVFLHLCESFMLDLHVDKHGPKDTKNAIDQP